MGPVEQLVVGEASEEVGQKLAQVLKAIYQGAFPLMSLGLCLVPIQGLEA